MSEKKSLKQIWTFKKGDIITYFILLAIWLVGMIIFADIEKVFPHYWFFMPFGILAATIAMSTPGGGGIVFFPIMVRLGVPILEVAAFSFAAQSIGMTFGSIRWLIEDIKAFRWKIILSTIPGGWIGLYLGTMYLLIEQVKTARFIYSIVGMLLCILTLYLQKKRNIKPNVPEIKISHLVIFFGLGLFGGLITSFIGFGINLCLFFFMVLIFRFGIKESTVASIITIALTSMMGFYLHAHHFGTLRWEFLQMVIPGIFTGAYIGPKLLLTIGSKNMMYMLVVLLSIEFIATVFFGK